MTKSNGNPMRRFFAFPLTLRLGGDTPAKTGYSGFVNVAKSSVQGLRNGAPLLKTDRFGDPSASSRCALRQAQGPHLS